MKGLIKNLKNQFKIGQVIKGKVLKIGKNEVWVDLDGLATGVVRGSELQDELEEYLNLKVGDKVVARIIEEENERGEVELSFRLDSLLKVKEVFEKIKKEGKVIEVKVVGANRGGLIVQYKRVQGFIPSSQLSSLHFPEVPDKDKNKILEKLKKLIGKILEVRIIDIQEGKKIIFSEKEAEGNLLFEKYKIGQVVKGKVTKISPFGVFVELDEKIRGLIHISELTWQRIKKIEDVVKIGEIVQVKILSIDNKKVSLSLKRLLPDPWQGIEKKYKIGEKVRGEILEKAPYGFLIKLEDNICGLVHVSEIPEEILNQPEKNPIGKKLDLKIVSLEPENHRLSLSLKD